MTREECRWWANFVFQTYKEKLWNKGMVEDAKAAEKAQTMVLEALSEQNCVKCEHYYETEEDGVVGHCRMDTAHQDLISRQEVLAEFKDGREVFDIMNGIEELPTVRPQGEWIADDGDATCSHCQRLFKGSKYDRMYNEKFCPNCGADMRGEEA